MSMPRSSTNRPTRRLTTPAHSAASMSQSVMASFRDTLEDTIRICAKAGYAAARGLTFTYHNHAAESRRLTASMRLTSCSALTQSRFRLNSMSTGLSRAANVRYATSRSTPSACPRFMRYGHDEEVHRTRPRPLTLAVVPPPATRSANGSSMNRMNRRPQLKAQNQPEYLRRIVKMIRLEGDDRRHRNGILEKESMRTIELGPRHTLPDFPSGR